MTPEDANPFGPMGGSLFDNMQGFADAAAAGAVKITEEGGEALLAVIKSFLDGMQDQAHNLTLISRPPPLGRLKGGEVMAPFMVEVATDENGFVTRFRELRESLLKAEEAIRQSMANYEATEEANRAAMNRLRDEAQ
ncbi:hypothetical protein [Actinokineospora iranica]|uniref:PE family protein n=1 Tax=Actinokineospora iranica TaxID=1271860 RepID=A0A1G6YEV5_9PSEU|nr:hypothetical protein [Actinokineospora iranica]SDD88257.1 hypothetical protein SAMN05216174_12120 [Actinokineospora iranica]